MCTWNEVLKVHEDFERLKSTHNSVLIFFEFINAHDSTIFWSFLKFLTPQFTNVDDKFQLQIFKYQKISTKSRLINFKGPKSSNDLTVFDQWQSMERCQVPGGILNVTVEVLNKKIVDHSKSPHQNGCDGANSNPQSCEVEINRKWHKLPGQACKVPNKLFKKLVFREKGSMNVRFNHDGNLIALTEVTSREGSILHIYKFPEMLEIFKMFEHSNLIHDIDWLRVKFGSWMLTASSDYTAIVWRLEESSYTYKILPHPSFVYAAKFLQDETTMSVLKVVTAGRDNIVRVWQTKKNCNENFELIQELNQPNLSTNCFITSIATKNFESFFTGNSTGEIIEWIWQANSKDYKVNRRFEFSEFHKTLVTSLELHPRGNKLFVRLHDHKNAATCERIFIIGIPTGTLTQKFQQISHHTNAVGIQQTHGKLKVSPCGSHLFSTNCQMIRFYPIVSGCLTAPSSQQSNYLNFRLPSSLNKITSLDYHPKDFYCAFSIYGYNGGVVIMNYEHGGSEDDIFDKFRVDPTTARREELVTTSRPMPKTFTEIIRRLDEVFFTTIDVGDDDEATQISRSQPKDDNTYTINEKRSLSYSVSRGPATFTIQPNRNNVHNNNTYEIQRDEKSDDDTTISESLN